MKTLLNLLAAVMLCTLGLWSQTAHAASDCGIGLKASTTTTPPTIDGEESAGEWTDASILDSTSPCFEYLRDYVTANDTYASRPVVVKSKRYSASGTNYMGFLIEVRDMTSSGPCAGGKLCVGEKLILHFNRTINGDTKLNVGEDRRFVLTHKWSSTGSQITDGAIEVEPPVSDASCTATSGVDVKWGAPGANGITFALRNNVTGGGYRAEIAVPVSFVTGTNTALAKDIGVAIAILNDFGKGSSAPGFPPDFNCAAGGTCEGAAASFPSSLPETNDANAVDALCDKGWVVPKQWGVGYLTSPPGQVTISRAPDYWNSNGITVLECNSPGYTYYPSRPCKALIRAQLRNNGATTRRKVVFLWAKHGTGDPAEYNFVAIKDAIVGAGSPGTIVETAVDSGLWSGVPKDQMNHPCLRVYLFPDGLSTTDEDRLKGTTTSGIVSKATLDAVVSANGVEEQHWAQKNITRHDTVSQCPNADCRVAASQPAPLDFSPIRVAMADDTGTTVTARPGMQVPSSELGRYVKDHVIVRLQTVAYRLPAGGRKPLYNLIEDFGGVVHLFPVAMVQESGKLPLTFQISNASTSTMRVKVLADVSVPAGVSGVTLNVPREALTLQPGSEQTVTGSVNNPGVAGECSGMCCTVKKKVGLALGVGVIAIGAAGAGLQRRRRRHAARRVTPIRRQ